MNRSHDIEGLFSLFATSESGRLLAVRSGYRPLHKVHENYMSSGHHQYPDVDEVSPGEVTKVLIWLISPDVYPASMWSGREIEISEGNRAMGVVKVTKVLNAALLGSPENFSSIWVEPSIVSPSTQDKT